MSQFTFIDPETGKEFLVKGAAGLTEEQAFEIYNKQKDVGSLINLKPGDILSAASQAAQGLTSALSQVSQGIAGIAGSVTGALGGAINKATQVATGLVSAPSLSSGLSGALGTAQSLASKTVAGIASAVKTLPVTNGINIADYAKQATALMPVGNLSPNNLTATLSQASKLVGQGADALTNSAGLGKYGLDCTQLERAGFVKPGTAGKYLASGVSDLTSVLNSPAVWTGKDGVANVDKLLSSIPKQDAIQQGLMATGLQSVSQLGIPIDKLNPKELAGTALNAAKSAGDTLKWAAGQALPTDVLNKFNTAAKDASFAVDFSELKIDSAMASEIVPPALNATVDRKTLNAAVNRVVGNKKIPEVSFDIPESITSAAAGASSSVNQGLYSSTKDEDLTYTGSDPLVWDRINAERLRRGLPGLAAIGYPRPPDEPRVA